MKPQSSDQKLADKKSSPELKSTGRKPITARVIDPKKNKGFSTLGDLFSGFQLEDKGGYISQEFQDFGYRLAVELDDMAHKSLYIKMAKKENRVLLEQALSFVSDASTAKSKARLFMWKVAQLKKTKVQQEALSDQKKST